VKLKAEFVKDNKRKLELFEETKDERIMEMDVDASIRIAAVTFWSAENPKTFAAFGF
jgi:hypothetical protein